MMIPTDAQMRRFWIKVAVGLAVGAVVLVGLGACLHALASR